MSRHLPLALLLVLCLCTTSTGCRQVGKLVFGGTAKTAMGEGNDLTSKLLETLAMEGAQRGLKSQFGGVGPEPGPEPGIEPPSERNLLHAHRTRVVAAEGRSPKPLRFQAPRVPEVRISADAVLRAQLAADRQRFEMQRQQQAYQQIMQQQMVQQPAVQPTHRGYR